MIPFRDPPRVELGPLEVGLGEATAKAIERMPSGGRLITPRTDRVTYARGAAGSMGLITLAVVAISAVSRGWLPQSPMEVGLVVLFLGAAGGCMAAVLQAIDHARITSTQSGATVGRKARLITSRIRRLSACAAEGKPHSFGAYHVLSLRRAIAAASDPEVATWIPNDLRGRAELLLARVIAANAGHRWTSDAALLAEVRALLVRAAKHLADSSPADADLWAINNAPVGKRDVEAHAEEIEVERAPQGRRITVAP